MFSRRFLIIGARANYAQQIIVDNLPFDFVERVTVANTKLLPTFSETFIKYMVLTHEATQKKVKEMLPPTFEIVVDGWTLFREHYFAMYADYTDANDNVQEIFLSCGVQEEVEDSDSMDFTAESIGDYIYNELQLLGLHTINVIVNLITKLTFLEPVKGVTALTLVNTV